MPVNPVLSYIGPLPIEPPYTVVHGLGTKFIWWVQSYDDELAVFQTYGGIEFTVIDENTVELDAPQAEELLLAGATQIHFMTG